MSKSRNEKKPLVLATPVPQTNDIIPGKFNDNQWNYMIGQENDQEFILDILDEILDCTVQVIQDKYIQRQLQPYSVDAAKNLLLQIIETRFLAHDKGEKSPTTDFTWFEDEEPIPCLTDSWSQGSVPVLTCESRPLSARSESRNVSPRSSEPGDIIPSRTEEQEARNDIDVDELFSKQMVDGDNPLDVIPSPPPTSRVTSPGRRKKHAVKGMKSKQSNKKTAPVVETQDDVQNNVDNSQQMKPIHQTRTSRAPGEQEVTYDEHGNIVAMMRLSVDKLPTHRIRPRYNILDPQVDHSHVLSTQSRKRKEGLPAIAKNVTETKKSKEKQMFKTPPSSISLEMQRDNGDIVRPLPPPLADSMDIASGVVVREGQLVRKGPDMLSGNHRKTEAEILNLQPVVSLPKRQTISVSDVIGNTSPVIRQMRLPDPIPPIAHRG